MVVNWFTIFCQQAVLSNAFTERNKNELSYQILTTKKHLDSDVQKVHIYMQTLLCSKVKIKRIWA